MKVLHFLYDQDVLSEEIIIPWHKKVKSEEDEDIRKAMRKQVGINRTLFNGAYLFTCIDCDTL